MSKAQRGAPETFRTRVLKNGLTVITVPRAGTEAATVSFLFRGGSRYETPRTNGIAHFNEHAVFKGGKRYPDYRAVTQAFDKIGAISNAFTGAEVTGFWAKTRATHILDVADVFSDVLTATAYDPAELDKERGVIIEEINMYEDDPASDLYQVLEAVTFPDHPLGRATLGPKENIKRFTPDDFRTYERQHQTPDRCVLVIAGKVDGLDEAKLDKLLGRFTGTSDVRPEPAAFTQSAPRLRVKSKPTEQTHIGLTLRAPSLADRSKSPVLSVLAQLLGGTMSSRLFTEVREKRGLAYYVRAMPDQLTDAGTLVVAAGVKNEQVGEAMEAIMHELKRLRDGDLAEDELAMHKDSQMGRLALRWEDSMALADFYGEQQLLLDEVRTTQEWLKEIAAVGRDQVIGLAEEIMVGEGLSAAVIGPHEERKLKGALAFG